MFTGIYQSAVILGVVVVFYAMDFWLISRYDRQRSAEGSGRSWDYTLMVLAAVVFLILQPALLPWLGVQIDAWWGAVMQAVGLLFLGGGMAGHGWARLHLRQFYAERVEVQPEHYVVDSGPYAYVRHPLITSFFMLAIGLLLVNPALPMVLLAGYTFWDFSRAAKQEEVLLGEELPGYKAYMSRVPRFLPRFHSHPGDS